MTREQQHALASVVIDLHIALDGPNFAAARAAMQGCALPEQLQRLLTIPAVKDWFEACQTAAQGLQGPS